MLRSAILLGRNHHDHLTPFHLGHLLDLTDFVEVGLDPFELAQTEFLVGHLAAAEAQGDLALVAFVEEALQVAQLDLIVVLVGARTELDLFDLDLLLLESGFVGLFLFLILELAEIHHLANRWLGHRRDFDKIQPGLFSGVQGCVQGNDAQRFAIFANQPDFGRVDLPIDALLLFLSDGSVLHEYQYQTEPDFASISRFQRSISDSRDI